MNQNCLFFSNEVNKSYRVNEYEDVFCQNSRFSPLLN